MKENEAEKKENSSDKTRILTAENRILSPDDSKGQTIQVSAFTDYYHKILIKSDDTFKEYDLKKEAIIIGRSANCDLPVADNTVSGQHAVVWVRENECVLKDMDSKNHTYLYDYDTKEWKPCYQRQLQKFDKIKIGSAVFMFIPAKSGFSRDEILQKFRDAPPENNIKKMLTALLTLCGLALIYMIFLLFQQK
jgi:pSer/pThr/pTyr-binding forkhead associated (FHA) protein